MTRRKVAKLALLALWIMGLMLLSGCVSGLFEERKADDRTLPGVKDGPNAPSQDGQTEQVVPVVLYLPDEDGKRLVTSVDEITVGSGAGLEDATVRRLLYRLSAQFPNLSGQPLQLYQAANSVEAAGSLVTVNLSGTARLLTNREQFLMRLCITNTLTELPGIDYVDILINGRDEGVDLAATIPCGVLARYPSTSDIDAYWRQVEGQINQAGSTAGLSKTIALYFTSADGTHLIPDVRNVVFSGYQQEIIIDTILSELAKGSASQWNTRQIMPPQNYIPDYAPPRIITPGGSAYRVISLTFFDGLDDYLAVMGGTRGMLFASLTYTLTSFVPGIDGLMITVGEEHVTQVEDMQGRTLHFDSGWMTRADFSGSVASTCTIYFPSRSGDALIPVERAVTQASARDPRTLLEELLKGPQYYDLQDDELSAVFPADISSADILSVAVEDDMVLIDFSENFATACESLNEVQGRNMIYSIVNTLTQLRGVRRVRFFIEGAPRQFMQNDLSTAGEFFRHPGLIR